MLLPVGPSTIQFRATSAPESAFPFQMMHRGTLNLGFAKKTKFAVNTSVELPAPKSLQQLHPVSTELLI